MYAQELQERKSEPGSLSGPGLGTGEKITLGENEGYGLALDRSGRLVALVGYSAKKFGPEAEGMKGHGFAPGCQPTQSSEPWDGLGEMVNNCFKAGRKRYDGLANADRSARRAKSTRNQEGVGAICLPRQALDFSLTLKSDNLMLINRLGGCRRLVWVGGSKIKAADQGISKCRGEECLELLTLQVLLARQSESSKFRLGDAGQE